MITKLTLDRLNKFAMQLSRSAIVCFVVVVVVVALVGASEDAGSPLNRLRRSVNFTPSWGKRSGGRDLPV
jgi:hypothetical protein